MERGLDTEKYEIENNSEELKRDKLRLEQLLSFQEKELENNKEKIEGFEKHLGDTKSLIDDLKDKLLRSEEDIKIKDCEKEKIKKEL
jgi:hypothetical protein